MPELKNPPANAGDIRDLNPESGKFPGGRHGNSLQYSCLENPMDRGAQQVTVPRITQNQTQLKQLSPPKCLLLITLITAVLRGKYCYDHFHMKKTKLEQARHLPHQVFWQQLSLLCCITAFVHCSHCPSVRSHGLFSRLVFSQSDTDR